MKQHLKEQMHKDIRELYTNIIKCHGANMEYIPRKAIISIIQESAAPRYYISAQNASRYVLMYYRADKRIMNYRHLDMVKDLADGYERLRKSHPYTPKSMLWEQLVDSPAPRYYLEPETIVKIIYNHDKYKNL